MLERKGIKAHAAASESDFHVHLRPDALNQDQFGLCRDKQSCYLKLTHMNKKCDEFLILEQQVHKKVFFCLIFLLR